MEKVVTTIRLPDKLKEQLHREATEKGLSLNTYILLQDKLFEKLSQVERRYLASFIEGMVASAELKSDNKSDVKIR